MKGWVKDNIGNYSISVPGYAFDSNAFKTEGIPVIKIANIKNGYIDLDDNSTEYVDEHYINSLNNKYQVRLGDILVSLTGSHLTQPNSVVGRVGRYRQKKISLLNQRAAKIEAIKSKCDNGFLYYLLSTNTLRKEIALLAYGAANQANVSHKDIEKIKVFFPSLPIQKKIAAILSAYDDLIENNNRRIAILEKMAEELYHEWFVRLRFPGHEKVKIVKGMPEGWEVKRMGNAFSIYLGGTPSRENSSFWGGDIPWINSGEINNARIITETEFITQAGYDSSATKLMPIHTTVLAITGATLGQVSFTEIKVCANQSVVGIYDETDVYNFYIYGFIRASIPIIISKQGGGGQQHINKDIVEKELIIVPPADLVKCYNQKASPVFERTAKLYFSNGILKKSCDRLLSRLMSGKIDVESMDIQIPTSMQEELAHA